MVSQMRALVVLAYAYAANGFPTHGASVLDADAVGSEPQTDGSSSFFIHFDCEGCYIGATYDTKLQAVQADNSARYSDQSKTYFFTNGSVVSATTESPPDRNATTDCKAGSFDNKKLPFSRVSRIDELRADNYTWLAKANITDRFDTESCALVTGIDKGCKPEGPGLSTSCLLIPAVYLNPTPCDDEFCAVTSACFVKKPAGASPSALDWKSLTAIGFHNEDGQSRALTGAVFQPGGSAAPNSCSGPEV